MCTDTKSLKAARTLLLEFQGNFLAYTDEYRALDEIIAAIEKLLGLE